MLELGSVRSGEREERKSPAERETGLLTTKAVRRVGGASALIRGVAKRPERLESRGWGGRELTEDREMWAG